MLRKRSFRHRDPRALSDRPPRKRRVTDRHFFVWRRQISAPPRIFAASSHRYGVVSPRRVTSRRARTRHAASRLARARGTSSRPTVPIPRVTLAPTRERPALALVSVVSAMPPSRSPTIPPILVIRHGAPRPPPRLTFRSTPLDAAAPRFAHRDSIELPELASDLILRDPTRDDG